MFIGGRSGMPITTERVTWQGEIKATAAWAGLMILAKVIILVWFVIAVILIDRIAGPILLIGGFWYMLTKRMIDEEKRAQLWLVFGLGVLLVVIEYFFQAWPRIIMWLWLPDRGFLVSWFGRPFAQASSFLIILRFVIGFVLPWMLWWPYRWTMWVSMAELLVPKFRETAFRPAAVESFPGPPGVGNLRSYQPVEIDDPNAHIPEIGDVVVAEVVGE